MDGHYQSGNSEPNAFDHDKQQYQQVRSSEGDGYYSGTPSVYSLLDATTSSQPLTQMHQFVGVEPAEALSQLEDNGGHDRDDVDSAYDNESLLGDDTQTLASYITDYRYEHGRRYHAYKDGSYWGPNDEHANELVDLAHHMYLITLDKKLHLAPIREPHNILDLGTGTGIWAIDMADQYPSARVLGTDLSPIQPDFVPPNCSFEIDDVTLDWTYPPDHFDFIHIREMFGSIPDWDYFFEQAFRHTKPGGWVEIVEHSVEPVAINDSLPPDHFYRLWARTVIECGEKVGKSFRVWREAKGHMERAGFVDVMEIRYIWPMNGWPTDPSLKEIGRFNQLRLHNGVEGFMLRLLTSVLGWSYQRSQLFLTEMRNNIKDCKTHAYLEGTVVYGRKPLPPGSQAWSG